MSIIAWIITGIVAGRIAGMLTQGSGFGVIDHLIVGLIGGYLGNLLGIAYKNWLGTVAMAAIGGVILTWILHLVRRGTATSRVRWLGAHPQEVSDCAATPS